MNQFTSLASPQPLPIAKRGALYEPIAIAFYLFLTTLFLLFSISLIIPFERMLQSEEVAASVIRYSSTAVDPRARCELAHHIARRQALAPWIQVDIELLKPQGISQMDDRQQRLLVVVTTNLAGTLFDRLTGIDAVESAYLVPVDQYMSRFSWDPTEACADVP